VKKVFVLRHRVCARVRSSSSRPCYALPHPSSTSSRDRDRRRRHRAPRRLHCDRRHRNHSPRRHSCDLRHRNRDLTRPLCDRRRRQVLVVCRARRLYRRLCPTRTDLVYVCDTCTRGMSKCASDTHEQFASTLPNIKRSSILRSTGETSLAEVIL
jgi:hypothetical protein